MTESKMFVAHVFNQEYMDDFRRAVSEVCKQLNIVSVYADDKLINGHILQDKIYKQIEEADICLFEISETQKPNVFIELGYAQGKNKQTVLVMKNGVVPPSDLAGIDRIEYSSFLDLEEKLKKYIPTLELNSAEKKDSGSKEFSIENPVYKTSNGFRNLLNDMSDDHEGLMIGIELFINHVPHVLRYTEKLVSVLNSEKSKTEKIEQINRYLDKLDKSFTNPLLIDKNKKIRYWLARSYIIVQQYLTSVKNNLETN